MWNWVNCYLSGRHDFGMWCERGAIFLRCVHCGKRSTGWTVDEKHLVKVPAPDRPEAVADAVAKGDSHVLPFRAAAR